MDTRALAQQIQSQLPAGARLTDLKICECGVPIFFVPTGSATLMPVNPLPADTGNLRMVMHGGELMCVVVEQDELFTPQGPEGTRWEPHWATCPNAGEWRKTR